jgi:hypothetical protein
MIVRRLLLICATLVTACALLGATAAEARERRCRTDKGCKSGECNDARRCCKMGEVACGSTCCNDLVGGTCCDGACVDTQWDESNCGGCGTVCLGGKLCEDGVCACRSHETECNGFCSDLMWDDQNCGTCGNQCGEGFSCFLGSCRCEEVGEQQCNGQCIDVLSDPNNCGACGNVCQAGSECVAGACEPPCDQPCHGRVNNVCVSLCDVGEVCDANGQCQVSCPVGQTPCGGQCVPTTSRGDGVCCQWNGQWHACAADEQCAGPYCCGAGTEVCVPPNGNAQCCYGGLVCQEGRCCYPDGVLGCPMAGGTACCSYGN